LLCTLQRKTTDPWLSNEVLADAVRRLGRKRDPVQNRNSPKRGTDRGKRVTGTGGEYGSPIGRPRYAPGKTTSEPQGKGKPSSKSNFGERSIACSDPAKRRKFPGRGRGKSKVAGRREIQKRKLQKMTVSRGPGPALKGGKRTGKPPSPALGVVGGGGGRATVLVGRERKERL